MRTNNKPKKIFKKIAGMTANMLYPPRCPVCDKIVTPGEKGVCSFCEEVFIPVGQIYCLKCGKPFRDERRAYCNDCQSRTHNFDLGRSAFVYDDNMRKCIYRFKYSGRKEYASYLGRIMYSELAVFMNSCQADGIIPVPMYKKKEKKRGYNQAFLLANELSHLSNIPLKNNIIIRDRDTKIMRSLGASERQNNLKKAFKIMNDSVKLTNVIVVDDIYTTGSTADAVAGELKAAGVGRVFVTSLSTGYINS